MTETLRIVPAAEFWAEMAQERDTWRKAQGYRGGYKPVQHRCDTCDHPVCERVWHRSVGLCRRCLRREPRAAAGTWRDQV